MVLFPFKLVRDQIPQRIREEGRFCIVRQLKGRKLLDAIFEKLLEEAKEVAAASTKDARIEELADLVEILATVMLATDIDPAEVAAIRKKKFERSGGFIKGFKLYVAGGS